MSKARTLADFISDGSEFADGTISVAEVSGAAPLASPSFTGNVGIGVTPATFYGRALHVHDTGTAGANIRLTDSNSGTTGNDGMDIIQINNTSYIINREAGGMNFYTGGELRYTIQGDGTHVFNENSLDSDFRVESDTNSHLLYVDSTNNRVNIGINDVTSSAQVAMQGSLAVGRTSTTTGDFVSGGGGNSAAYNGVAIMSNAKSNSSQNNTALNSWIVDVGGRAGDGVTFPVGTQNTFSVRYWPAGTSAYSAKNFLNIGAGSTVINEDSNDHDFRVESDSNANMFFVDAGASTATFGTNSAYGVLGVQQGASAGIPATTLGLNHVHANNKYIDFKWYNGSLMDIAQEGGSNIGINWSNTLAFNSSEVNSDFRIASDSISHLFAIDASENRVSIGGTSFSEGSGYLFNVRGGASRFVNPAADVTVRLEGGGYTDPHTARLHMSGGAGDNSRVNYVFIDAAATGGGGNVENNLNIGRNEANVGEYSLLKFDYEGRAIFNDDGVADGDFRVESDSNANAFTIDAGQNSGQGAVLVGTGSMFGTGNTDYIAHTMTQAASTTPMLVNGAMFAMPDIPSGKQAQAGRWKFGGFKNHWYASAGTRVDSSLSQLVVEISGGASGKTDMELFELGFNRGWDSRFVMIEVFEVGYINGGYKKYLFHGGYDPSFTLFENIGNNSIALNVLAEGPFQNGTSSVSSSTVDQSYYRKTVRATLGAYYTGHIVVTIPSYMKITNNTEVDNPYLMRLLNPQ